MSYPIISCQSAIDPFSHPGKDNEVGLMWKERFVELNYYLLLQHFDFSDLSMVSFVIKLENNELLYRNVFQCVDLS